MPRMNPGLRAVALALLQQRQKEFCKINNIQYNGDFCELKVEGGIIDQSTKKVRKVSQEMIASGGLYGEVEFDGRPCKGEWVVDHVDNDNDHNPVDGSNWQILCKGGNGRKNKRGPSRNVKYTDFNDLKESLERIRVRLEGRKSETSRKGNDYSTISAELEKSGRCKKVVVDFVDTILTMNETVKVKDLALGAAKFTMDVYGPDQGVDQQTTERYIEVLAAPFTGDYVIYDKYEGSGKRAEYWIRRKQQVS